MNAKTKVIHDIYRHPKKLAGLVKENYEHPSFKATTHDESLLANTAKEIGKSIGSALKVRGVIKKDRKTKEYTYKPSLSIKERKEALKDAMQTDRDNLKNDIKQKLGMHRNMPKPSKDFLQAHALREKAQEICNQKLLELKADFLSLQNDHATLSNKEKIDPAELKEFNKDVENYHIRVNDFLDKNSLLIESQDENLLKASKVISTKHLQNLSNQYSFQQAQTEIHRAPEKPNTTPTRVEPNNDNIMAVTKKL